MVFSENSIIVAINLSPDEVEAVGRNIDQMIILFHRSKDIYVRINYYLKPAKHFDSYYLVRNLNGAGNLKVICDCSTFAATN